MVDSNCIFCKIAQGQIPSATLYEDANFRVILDIAPASKGHCLILPKEHARGLMDLDEPMISDVLPLARYIMERLQPILQCDGFHVLQNNEAIAGQTVFHYHTHLIPRYEGDQVGLTWSPGVLDDATRADIMSAFEA